MDDLYIHDEPTSVNDLDIRPLGIKIPKKSLYQTPNGKNGPKASRAKRSKSIPTLEMETLKKASRL